MYHNVKPVKTAIIGCGDISDIYFENLIHRFSIIDLVKCASKGGASAQVKSEKYGIQKSTVEDIMADPEIELIVNLTPAPAHYTLIHQALQSGKHVYTEKVITPESENAKELIELAKSKNLYLCSAPDHFLGSAWQHARDMIDRGMLGTITSVYACVSQDMNVFADRLAFINEPAGGIGFDFGIYLITEMVGLLGPVKGVCGIVETMCPNRIHKQITHPHFGESYTYVNEDMMMGSLKFASGAIGTIHLNGNSILSAPPQFLIYGTEGVLSLPNPGLFSGEMKFFRPGSFEPIDQISAFGFPHNSRGVGVAEMAWALRQNRTARADAQLGSHCLEVLQGLQISSQTRQFYTLQSSCTRPEPLESGYRGMQTFAFDEEGAIV